MENAEIYIVRMDLKVVFQNWTKKLYLLNKITLLVIQLWLIFLYGKQRMWHFLTNYDHQVAAQVSFQRAERLSWGIFILTTSGRSPLNLQLFCFLFRFLWNMPVILLLAISVTCRTENYWRSLPNWFCGRTVTTVNTVAGTGKRCTINIVISLSLLPFDLLFVLFAKPQSMIYLDFYGEVLFPP